MQFKTEMYAVPSETVVQIQSESACSLGGICKILGIKLATLPKSYQICFPLFGLVIAIFTYFILVDESKKITAVNKAKYRISESMEEKYRYVKYVDDMSAKKNQLTFSLAKYVLIVELVLCGIVIGMLIWDINTMDLITPEMCRIFV